MAFGQDQYTGRTMRFELVERLGDYIKPAPLSNTCHYIFKMF